MNDCNTVRVPDKLLRQGVNEELQWDNKIWASPNPQKFYIKTHSFLSGQVAALVGFLS